MRFSEIAGQEAIRQRLLQAVRTNRVSHALLLTGSPGCGHFALALALAQYLQCSSPGPDDSCGVCPACHQAAQFIHPDIHFVFPVVKAPTSKEEPSSDDHIGKWRTFLTGNPYPTLEGWYQAMGVENKQAGIFKQEAEDIIRKLGFKSFESDYKVVLCWMPEKMNPTAANKLLKILEEPADHTLFLFVSESTDNILPTVLSRTQLVKVPRIPDEALRKRLLQDYPDQDSLVQDAVLRARGDYLAACELIGRNEQMQLNHRWFTRMMRVSYAVNYEPISEFVTEIADIGRERQKWFLQYALGMIRNNFLLNSGLPELTLMDPEEADFSVKFNAFIHPGNIDPITADFNLAIAQITMNANPKILFTDMCLRLSQLLRVSPPPRA